MNVRSRLPLVLSALLLAAGASFVAVSAAAAPVPQTGIPGLLALEADPYPAQDFEIAPGERVYWPVTARLDAPTSGELSVRVTGSDPLTEDVAGLRVELASCEEEWVIPVDARDPATCDGGTGTVEIPESAFAALDQARSWDLGFIAPGEPRHFLVTLSLPSSTPGALAAEAGQIAIGFFAADRSRPERLGLTGQDLLGPALLAAGLLVGGLGLARVDRTRGGGAS